MFVEAECKGSQITGLRLDAREVRVSSPVKLPPWAHLLSDPSPDPRRLQAKRLPQNARKQAPQGLFRVERARLARRAPSQNRDPGRRSTQFKYIN